jgi:hypothetical protein
MSSLKITDLNTRRDAEVMAMPVKNTVTEHMANARNGNFGFQSNGAEWAAGTASGAVTVNGKTTQGIEPRAGARALDGIQRLMGKA